jgi:hypothetical protein
MNLVTAISISLLAAVPRLSLAGSPDGLQLLILGTDRSRGAQQKVAQYLDEYQNSVGNFDCDDYTLNIASTVQGPVATISSDKAMASISDKKQRLAFFKTLSKYRDQQHKRGFDGALLYDVHHGTLKLYGISAWTKEKIHRTEIGSHDWNNKDKFRLAMCRALAEMPVLQSP